MPTTPEYRRVFERLRAQGDLDIVLALIRDEMATIDARLLAMLATTLITQPEQMAELHAQQGRHSAMARLLAQLKELSLPPVVIPPRAPDSPQV